MGASGDTTKLYPLAIVVERCEVTRGKVVDALRGTELLALTATEIDSPYRNLPARVLIVDSAAPGTAELADVRSWQANDRTGHLQVVLLGDVAEQELPVELAGRISVYIRKPVEWEKAARVVVQIANRRRPSTTSRIIRMDAPRN